MKRIVFILVIGLFIVIPQAFCTDSSNNSSLDGVWEKVNPQETGPHATMVIENVNNKQFDFTIDASFVNTYIGENGNQYLNANEGKIEGTALFKSPTEAVYQMEDRSAYGISFNEFPDYQMVFLIKGDSIEILEINTKSGEDYDGSPYAGLNVTYRGAYIKKK